METNDQCRYDYLTVKDSDGVQLHKLCGQNSKNVEVELQNMKDFGQLDNVQVMSSGENITLTFGSDSVQVRTKIRNGSSGGEETKFTIRSSGKRGVPRFMGGN